MTLRFQQFNQKKLTHGCLVDSGTSHMGFWMTTVWLAALPADLYLKQRSPSRLFNHPVNLGSCYRRSALQGSPDSWLLVDEKGRKMSNHWAMWLIRLKSSSKLGAESCACGQRKTGGIWLLPNIMKQMTEPTQNQEYLPLFIGHIYDYDPAVDAVIMTIP